MQGPEKRRYAADIRSETIARSAMVKHQLERRGIRDPRVLAAMEKTPREAFVAEGYQELAYEDSPLPIGEGQTISQPYIVAAMAEAAEIKPGDKVLEVGTGSGYAAAVFSELAGQVYTIERHAALAMSAERKLAEFGYGNVQVRIGDGTRGWPWATPFDAIIVAAAAPGIPDALKTQLAICGRLVVPVGGARSQSLVKITRKTGDVFEAENLGPVAFVPLIGEAGWAERP